MERQPPGPALCAWDWWSLGRVVQEFVLGRHIYQELLQRDVSQGPAGFRSQAEDLLNEVGGYPVRAGAVELMSGMYDSQISLLRGLLTTARIARWGFREVQQWLEHRPVKDRYDNPRDERYFIRPEGIYTMPEVAVLFAHESRWREGEANLFNPGDPETFAHFVASQPGNYDLQAQLKGLFDLDGIPEWSGLPETARRSALAALAWATLAGPQLGLQVRGRRIAHHELLTLLHGAGDQPALGRALLVPSYVRMLQQADAETASLLSEVAGRHAAVLAEAVKNGWATAGDQEASNQLLTWCLESPHALAEALHRLRSRHVGTLDPAAKALLAEAKSELIAQILLAFADGCPERFGFITQETVNRERYEQLEKEGRRVAAALFWLRLRVVLESNPLVFGSWIILAAGWLALAAFARVTGLHLEPHGGIVLLVGLPPILRLAHWSCLRRVIATRAPEGRPWRWRDGTERCRGEMAAVLPGSVHLSDETIARQLADLNGKIAEIPLVQTVEPVPAPNRLPALWTTSIACWLIAAVVFCSAAVNGIRQVRANSVRITDALRGPSLQAGAGDADVDSRSPRTDWSFGDPRRTRIAWDLPPPAAMPRLAVGKVQAATPDQVAFALVEGEQELLPYLRRTVKPLIAIRVPTETGVGLILFDSRDGTVAERRIYLVAEAPPVHSWFTLGRNQVVYLGPSPREIDPGHAEPAETPPGAP